MFRDVAGNEIKLEQAYNLPGYEVNLATDIVIESAVNNPFFKGINILQLPKKVKGFRDNSDLKDIFAPKILETGIISDLSMNEFILFEPKLELVFEKRLMFVTRVFGNNQRITPMCINFGIRNIKLKAGSSIGTLIIQKSEI